MKKLNLFLAILTLMGCSNENNIKEILPNDLPKISNIYLINSFGLKQSTGIELDFNELSNESYVQNLIQTTTQLTDSEFDEVCHIEYDINGFVNSYKIGTNQIMSWRFDQGGTIQRDNNGNVKSINNNPVVISNNNITFKRSDGWSTSNAYDQQVDFSGNKIIKTYFKNATGTELSTESYTYQYNDGNFLKKNKTGSDFVFYEVSDYYNDDFNLPWIIHRSKTRLSLEIAFGLRLMKKIPKKIINSQQSEQDVDITNIIKDQLDRPILIIGRNFENNIDYLAIY